MRWQWDDWLIIHQLQHHVLPASWSQEPFPDLHDHHNRQRRLDANLLLHYRAFRPPCSAHLWRYRDDHLRIRHRNSRNRPSQFRVGQLLSNSLCLHLRLLLRFNLGPFSLGGDWRNLSVAHAFKGRGLEHSQQLVLVRTKTFLIRASG